MFDWGYGCVSEQKFIIFRKLRKAVVCRCSYEKVIQKHASNKQENTHAEVLFQ